MRRLRLFAAGAAMLTLASVLCGCTGSSHKPDQAAAQAFLTALGSGDASAAAARTDMASAATPVIAASLTGLGAGARGTFEITSMTDRTATRATAHYTASWAFPHVKTTWTYAGTLPLGRAANTWHVNWSPTDVQPQLRAGQHLAAVRTQPTRAGLLDSSGQALFTSQPVVLVGIDATKVTDLNVLAATLASVLHISAADILSSVQAAPPGQFVPVVTLRQAAYEQVQAQIHDLPGALFRARTELLGPTSRFAQPLLGSVGPATKQIVDASHGLVVAGDSTGVSGLQLALDDRLGGIAGLSVYTAADADGSDVAKLADLSAPVTGTPVTLTLNSADQNAADAALAAVPLPAAVVLTQPSTGKILAVANSAAATDDIALVGQFPPGSTFKMVTYTAAFDADPTLTPTTPVDCPGSVVVNGQTIPNENGFAKATIPLSAAFAFSCNTSAVNLGLKLPEAALPQAAAALGLGAKWTLPVEAFSGSIPAPASPNEMAADSIGQGKVLVSPLLMAEIAGAAATGKPVAPSLVAGQQATPGQAQPAQVTADLNTLMRAVVAQDGATAHALADLPGLVEGKTGTAEFGTDVPPKSHSWFAGTRGDLAISVFVYGGEKSSTVAVPIAHSVLAAIP